MKESRGPQSLGVSVHCLFGPRTPAFRLMSRRVCRSDRGANYDDGVADPLDADSVDANHDMGVSMLTDKPQRRRAPVRLVLFLFLAGLLSPALPNSSQAQNILDLSASSPSGELVFQIELEMNFSEPTVGGGLRLAYDPAALVLEDIEFDPGLGDDPDFRCPHSQTITCPADPAFLSFGSVNGLSGQKTVAVLTFRFLEASPAAIGLENVSAFGGIGGAELATVLEGTVAEPGAEVPALSPGSITWIAAILLGIGLWFLGRRRTGFGTAGTALLVMFLLCPSPANAQANLDSDGDGILDSVDNCVLTANPTQTDTNQDGHGNLCDPDLDGDNVVSASDVTLIKGVFFGNNADADFDGSGIVDFKDLGRMAAYYNDSPGPRCAQCPLSTESGEFYEILGSPISIPDDASDSVSNTLQISETGVIFDLSIWLIVRHTWVGDLIVSLTHEETGTQVVLIDRPGVPGSGFGCSGNDIEAVLDDEATELAEEACETSTPAITGQLQPSEALSAFDGEGIGGSWTLTLTDAGAGVSGSLAGWGLYLNDPPPSPDVDMVAFRPQSESYGNPLQRRSVPEAEEEGIGAGIRINTDDDDGDGVPDSTDTSVAGENDLIEVELHVYAAPAEPGMEYVLRRTHDHIRVWESADKNVAILDANDESTLDFETTTRSVWVESPNGGEAFLEFEAREIQSSAVVSEDRIRFFHFTTLVIGLHGEFQFPTDPIVGINEGISMLAIDFHEAAYDSHMYIENKVEADGSGDVYDEIVSAIQNRGVTNLAIYGFSHGGGSLYDLSERLEANKASIGDFDLLFTAYIDGVENDSDVDLDAEVRLPIGTQYHVNYYQSSILWWIWGDSVPGADVDELVSGVTHISITIDPDVLQGIYTPLLLRVPR